MNEENNWEELIDRHLRGELDEAEKEQLAELLDSDAAARRDATLGASRVRHLFRHSAASVCQRAVTPRSKMYPYSGMPNCTHMILASFTSGWGRV